MQHWVKAAKKGNRLSFEKLVQLTQDRIFAHCWRILQDEAEAADATQETFIKFWLHLDRFDCRRPVLPWLYRIATNYCLDRWRRWKRMVRLDQLEVGGEIWSTATQGDSVEQEAEKEEVRQAVRQLPKNYRAALSLYYFEGYRYREIAQIMGVSINTVKSWIRRGKEKLKLIVKS